LPVTSIVDQMFGALLAVGRGGWDHVALLTLIEDWAGYREANTTNRPTVPPESSTTNPET
jgi:hypothetical protein